MASSVYTKTLQRAAELLGGKETLRALLRVQMRELEAWFAGVQPPMHIFLKAVDVISTPPVRTALMIESTLDEALDVARARKGNVQLRHQDGLRIVAHRGFQAPFLDYFACVNDEASACGRAMHRHERILIRDILSDPIGATPAGGVLVEAGVRAVQSTPIVGAAGGVIGMISTHYEFPLHDGGVEFDMLDRIAERAALFLEGDAVPR